MRYGRTRRNLTQPLRRASIAATAAANRVEIATSLYAYAAKSWRFWPSAHEVSWVKVETV